MGSQESVLKPVPAGFPYACITLRQYGKVRLIYGSDNEVNLIRQAILENWEIVSEKVKYEHCHQFTLAGSPFSKGTSSDEAAAARQVACSILRQMYNIGWVCLVSTDLTRTMDLTTLIMARWPGGVTPTPAPIACISLSSTDKLQVINFPREMHQMVKKSVVDTWGYGIQADGYTANNTYEIKLHGTPWTGYGDESIQARQVLMRLVNDLYNWKYVLYTSSNIKSTADSMFFRFDAAVRPSSSDNHMAISLNRTDRLRLMNSSEQIVSVVRQALLSVSNTAIQKEKSYSGAYEFKLSGNPWWSTGDEGVYARLLVLKVMESLRTRGWQVFDSVDISRRLNDKSVLVFRRCPDVGAHKPFLCLALSDLDKMRLINAPHQVVALVQSCVASQWMFGVESEKPSYHGSYQWRLGGICPWADWGGSGHNGLHGRSLLLFVADALQQRHWRLVVSADVSAKYVHQKNGPDYPVDVDSWYFMYDEEFTPPCPTDAVVALNPTAPTEFDAGPPSYKDVFGAAKSYR